MSSFEETIRSHGLRPRGIVRADGKWHRCPTESHPRKRNGSYKLAESGRIGWFRDFGLDQTPHTWRPDRGVELAPYDPAWLKRAQEEAREAGRAASLAAERFYLSCAPLQGGHPYLASHGLDATGTYGLRVDAEGWLVVPAYRNRQIKTVQRISADGDKLFWRGAPKKGASFTIERQRASITVICEGLATGLAVFAAVPESRVVVAFDAGNLQHIQPPTGMAVIAADNDWETVCPKHRDEGLSLPFTPWEERPEWCRCNPGRCAATDAAAAIKCGIALPDGIEGTDWDDWRREILEARVQMRRPKERETDIRRAVDVQLAMQIKRNARFIAPQKEMAR